jgi:hypothetical protein
MKRYQQNEKTDERTIPISKPPEQVEKLDVTGPVMPWDLW